MFSAPEDFAVLCQLMLGGGKYGNVRLVSPQTVELMTTNRMDDHPMSPNRFAAHVLGAWAGA